MADETTTTATEPVIKTVVIENLCIASMNNTMELVGKHAQVNGRIPRADYAMAVPYVLNPDWLTPLLALGLENKGGILTWRGERLSRNAAKVNIQIEMQVIDAAKGWSKILSAKELAETQPEKEFASAVEKLFTIVDTAHGVDLASQVQTSKPAATAVENEPAEDPDIVEADPLFDPVKARAIVDKVFPEDKEIDKALAGDPAKISETLASKQGEVKTPVPAPSAPAPKPAPSIPSDAPTNKELKGKSEEDIWVGFCLEVGLSPALVLRILREAVPDEDINTPFDFGNWTWNGVWVSALEFVNEWKQKNPDYEEDKKMTDEPNNNQPDMAELPEAPFSATVKLWNVKYGVEALITVRALTVKDGLKRLNGTLDALVGGGTYQATNHGAPQSATKSNPPQTDQLQSSTKAAPTKSSAAPSANAQQSSTDDVDTTTIHRQQIVQVERINGQKGDTQIALYEPLRNGKEAEWPFLTLRGEYDLKIANQVFNVEQMTVGKRYDFSGYLEWKYSEKKKSTGKHYQNAVALVASE